MLKGAKRWPWAILMFFPSTAVAADPPERFSPSIDTSAADAVLAAATSDPLHAAASAAAATTVPAVQAMSAKEHKYSPEASADSFRASVVALANGGSTKPFALDEVRAKSARVRALLDALQQRRVELTARLVGRLKAFTPPGPNLHATLAVVLGSHQNGWVPDQKTPVFYIDAGLQGDDVDGLIAVAAHELFHVVQGAAQPDWTPLFNDSTSASPREREMHNLHAAFMNLVIEGMADYVGDPAVFPGTGSTLTHDRREYARNLARSGETFALFDTIVFRFSHEPAAPLGTLLGIGFGGSWDQTGYYVGYAMAKAIDRYLGRDRLRALVSQAPEEFLADYIAVSRAHPADPDMTPLAATTIEAVTASRAWQSRGGHE